MMDAADRELFIASLRQAVRGDLDRALVDVGWHDALHDDPRTAVSTLFELQGEHDATSTALDSVVAMACELPPSRLVLPAFGGHAAPGRVDRDRLCVRGLCRGDITGRLHVVAATSEGYLAMPLDATDLQVRAITGMAPALRLAEVTADVVPTVAERVDWTAGVAAAHRALAHELVGTSRAMLRLAREHALQREQFGRPIASFQAVRHRLAEALVAVESAQAAADAAWDDLSPTPSLLAKAVAGRSARVVAGHAQQVLAGMGFTTEHPLHRYIRRALVLDGLFGSSRALLRQIGEDVLRRRQLPDPIPL